MSDKSKFSQYPFKSGDLTDHSGFIAAGDAAQAGCGSNAGRRYLLIENPHATEDLWFNFTTDAVLDSPSHVVPAKTRFIMDHGFCSVEAISVIAHTTNHKYTIKEG